MADDYIFRRAKSQDLLGIATAHVRSWQSAYKGLLPDELLDGLSIERRAEMWERALASPHIDLFVASAKNEEIVGFVCAGPTRDEDASPHRAEISAIYALPAVWGQKVGYRLMQAGLDGLRKRTFSQASLWVLEENERGINFYERFGFVRDAAPKGFKLDQLGTAVVREWRYLIDL
ncbi:MAG: GNAT family N-acetyltransferase [Chloroflexota bacterium]